MGRVYSPPHLPQLLVIGPWPFALLCRIYQCLRSLAEDVMNITIDSTSVVCPRCRQTTLALRAARKHALKHPGGAMVLKECEHKCWSRTLVWTGRDESGIMDHDTAEIDADSSSSEEAEHNVTPTKEKFDVSGFALWLAGLSPIRATKKRTSVVNTAFVWAGAAENAEKYAHMVDHAWSVLETYVLRCNCPHGGCQMDETLTHLVCHCRYLRTCMERVSPLRRIPWLWVPFRSFVGEGRPEEELRHPEVAALVPSSALDYMHKQDQVDLSGTHCGTGVA